MQRDLSAIAELLVLFAGIDITTTEEQVNAGYYKYPPYMDGQLTLHP